MLYSLRSTPLIFYFFFFNDTATTEIYTLSLHDALPICRERHPVRAPAGPGGALEAAAVRRRGRLRGRTRLCRHLRSEEHTSELQSQSNLVCRLLLEKKKNRQSDTITLITRTGTSPEVCC